ncbi:hypothetical protein ABQY74_016730 [Xanthomonas sp. WHRI 7064]|uniref:hypothetical protein n=1 Tax=Xanthomonas sp. WHRI 7064 TaxID=3161568 RepID=UPI0032E899C4
MQFIATAPMRPQAFAPIGNACNVMATSLVLAAGQAGKPRFSRVSCRCARCVQGRGSHWQLLQASLALSEPAVDPTAAMHFLAHKAPRIATLLAATVE